MIEAEFIGDEVKPVRGCRQPLARAIGLLGSDGNVDKSVLS
jgi:hypothetical protein